MTVRGGGRGGRNVEFLLSLAVGSDGLPGVLAVAGDTDGVDGAEEVAGALITPTPWRAPPPGASIAKERLADNDGHGFFEALGDQIMTGPTLTNVNDFRAVLITAGGGSSSRRMNMRRQRNAKIVATLGPQARALR